MDAGDPTHLKDFDAVLFDLDGVVTQTADVHATAWKELFDDFLRGRASGHRFRPFDIDRDYRRYVDGRPRDDGVRSFLGSRGMSLPDGTPSDLPSARTVHGLGNRKNLLFLDRVRRGGLRVFESSVALIRDLKQRGVKVAVVSSSDNCEALLEAAGLSGLFDVIIDGAVAEQRGLSGKPAPDTFLEAAVRLGVDPERAAVIEDAEAGVEAGRRGRFRLVVGVDRAGNPDRLRQRGADVVVSDLAELTV